MKTAAPRSAIDHLLKLATRLPWWGALLLALAAYNLLHPVALLQVPTPTGTMDVVASALGQLTIFVAEIGQYLLPLVFLTAAATSGFVHWKRDDLRESVVRDTSGSILRGLPRKDFELLVGDAFRRRGYGVRSPWADSRHHNKDLELRRDGRHFLVDCSDWRSSRAGAAAVRALHSRLEATGATGGFAVTSGQFTPEARHFAAEKDIELIDGRQLKELVCYDPQPMQENLSFGFGKMLFILAGWRELMVSSRNPRHGESKEREPIIGDVSGQAGDPPSRSAGSTMDEESASTDDVERATGRQLAALIRAESRIEGNIATKTEIPPLPVQKRRIDPRRSWRALSRIRARKVIDAGGVIATIGFLWVIYGWFLRIPDMPEDTPWALLGANSDSGAVARRLQGLGRDRSAAAILQGKRPLGQFRFGPPPGTLTAEKPKEIPVPEEKPIEVYHSLRELEMAFDAKYVPPPECYAIESNDFLVKCANHRIRARRSFIAGGGKVTETLLGSWEEPRTIVTQLRPQDWRDYYQGDSQQSPAEQQDWRQEWMQRPTAEPDGDWRRDWARQPTPDPTRDWRRDWSQGAYEDRGSDRRTPPLPIERRHWVDDF